MYQLNLFEVIEQNHIDNLKESIESKLSKYEIDELYRKQFKGQTVLLREIYETLSKETNYQDYMNDLISELLKIVPMVKTNSMFKEKGIFEYGNSGRYGYTTSRYEINGIKYNGSSGPLYCLEMLPKHFFKELIK